MQLDKAHSISAETNHRDGDGWRTGYGPKVRLAAERWKIALPD